MFKIEKKLFFNLKILKLLLITPILFSIPLFTTIKEAKAALEFQWDQDSGYRRLKWFQKENERKFRNTIYFFLRPSDRKDELLKINLAIPKNFKTKLKKENISLCKVKIGGFETKTKCIENIPADIEIKEDNSALDIYPYRSIPSNKDSYAIVLKIFNPRKTGLYQFHSYGQYIGTSVSSYLGSWTIVID